MASSDWTQLSDNISGGSIAVGVTAGLPRPPGGGSFLFGMNSLDTTVGCYALIANASGFAPTAKGAQVSGAIERAVSGGPTNFAPFIFACLQSTLSTGTAYMLGLSDADPHRIELRKGTLAGGLPDAAVTSPPTSGVLAKSTNTFPVGTWLHLRLDVIANPNGDVVLNCYMNDLTVEDASVTSPTWIAIDGIAQFIDDALQVNTGSAPLTSGYIGFGGQTSNVNRRMLFDYLIVAKQT